MPMQRFNEVCITVYNLNLALLEPLFFFVFLSAKLKGIFGARPITF